MIHTLADGTAVDVRKIAAIEPVVSDFNSKPSYSFCVTFDGGAEVIVPQLSGQQHIKTTDGGVMSMFRQFSYSEVVAMREGLVSHFEALP